MKHNEVNITQLGSVVIDPPEIGQLQPRGLKRKKPTSTKCHECGDVIDIGESYIRYGGSIGANYCLWCVKYE